MLLLHLDNSQIVSETTTPISGDMAVDAVKCVEESSVVATAATEDDSDSKTNDRSVSLPADTKDNEVSTELPQLEAEPKLSRNSSQSSNTPKVYEKDFLLSLREHASDHAINMSNVDNMRDIIKKVCFFRAIVHVVNLIFAI